MNAVRVETGTPGAVVEVEEVDGVHIERNGAGSVVSRVYPYGLDDEYEDESPDERVDRLTVELKDAKRALRAVS